MHIGAFKHGPAVGVDNLALLGDDVVIIDHVFTDIEVVAFNLCLCLLDEARDHAALQRHIFFHAHHFHDFRHAVCCKAAQQFVVESEEETRLTRVALAPRTTTQLVVDTAGLVAFGADDVQTSQRYHSFVVLLTLAHLLLQQLVLFFLGHVFNVLLDSLFFVCLLVFGPRWHFTDIVDLLGVLAQDAVEVALGIAAEQNVSTTTSHVRSNGDASAATCLCHDLCLTRVILRVQYVMGDALPIQFFG